MPEPTPDERRAEARAAFLRQLSADEFLPPVATLRAYRRRAGQGLPGVDETDHSTFAEEQLWRERVDDFAARFFALPPDERRRQWESVRRAYAGTPPLVAHLDALKPGLAVDLAAAGAPDTPAGRLARHIGELFVLRPEPRAVRRRELLDGLGEGAGEYQGAAALLKKSQPALAGLEPALLDGLVPDRVVEQKLTKTRVAREHVPNDGTRLTRSTVVILVLGLLAVGRVGMMMYNSPPQPRLDPAQNQPFRAPLKLQQFRFIEKEGKRELKEIDPVTGKIVPGEPGDVMRRFHGLPPAKEAPEKKALAP